MGLIGENGAGKSTTINCILNEISKTDGNIEIFGKDYLSEIEIKDKMKRCILMKTISRIYLHQMKLEHICREYIQNGNEILMSIISRSLNFLLIKG